MRPAENIVTLNPSKVVIDEPEAGQYFISNDGRVFLLSSSPDYSGNLYYAAMSVETGRCWRTACTSETKAVLNLKRYRGEVKIQAV